MPSADDYIATVHRYLELLASGSADEIAALYTDDATIEDPVGSDVRRGRDAVHEFYAAIEGLDKEAELLTLRAAGNEAAFWWRLTVAAGDSGTRIEPISVMTFDEDAKITSMRAFWSPSDVAVLQ
ncbi:MAG: nuclear transport factor 2 family protein [Mycobacteriaceae bacterium]|nr:nuclear transport factor 2 family protein [Mycobacteriaceae bacterium]